MPTYYAAQAMTIQGRPFQPGDVLGSGDIDKGKFTAEKGLEKIVEHGHVVPRLQDGRIVTKKPADLDQPTKAPPKKTQKPANEDGTPEGK